MNTNINHNRKLYELIESIGFIQEGDFHIIDNSGPECIKALKEGEYRIYIKAGYCFDICKSFICSSEDADKFPAASDDGFTYAFFAEWPGFLAINANLAYMLTLAFKNDRKNNDKQ